MNSFVITSHLHTSFRKIGAFVEALPVPTGSRRVRGEVRRRITVRDRTFELTLSPNTLAVVSDCRPDERHLVLNLQNPGAKPERFLCGFDERHWFVAAVRARRCPRRKIASCRVRSVKSRNAPACGMLISIAGIRPPSSARVSGSSCRPVSTSIDSAFTGVNRWFVPAAAKPHIVDELVRGTGEMVWHHARHAPNGINDAQRAALPADVRRDSGWNRRMRVLREGSVLARGAVRHPDHATSYLAGWHRVFINSEVRPASLGFLD